MHVPLTLGVLAAVTGILVLLRIFWSRIPRGAQWFLIACAVIIPVVFVIGMATRWSVTPARVNFGIYWLCIASYEFLLILFTRLRPRWLTSIIAILLILPVLSASIFVPLALFFAAQSVTTARLGGDIVSERVPWGLGTDETSGTDLTIYYQPRWAPWLHRRIVSNRYYGGQCDAWSAYAVILPGGDNVRMICPASPNLPPNSAESIVWPLYRPLFFNPHKEVKPSSR